MEKRADIEDIVSGSSVFGSIQFKDLKHNSEQLERLSVGLQQVYFHSQKSLVTVRRLSLDSIFSLDAWLPETNMQTKENRTTFIVVCEWTEITKLQ